MDTFQCYPPMRDITKHVGDSNSVRIRKTINHQKHTNHKYSTASQYQSTYLSDAATMFR